ncbi:MAG: hypothetical protein ABEK17_00445 [Candidatus Aenigmatarchaeota archaeon]
MRKCKKYIGIVICSIALSCLPCLNTDESKISNYAKKPEKLNNIEINPEIYYIPTLPERVQGDSCTIIKYKDVD